MRIPWNKKKEIGNKYNHLTIIEDLQSVGNVRFVKCICDCGKNYIGNISNIRRGLTKTCGCWMKVVSDLDGEKWEKVDGLNYFVSNKGRVKGEKGIIKPHKMNSGYYYYRLYDKDKKIYKQFLAHRLVIMTFIGKSKLDVNHKDGNKLNNNLENLEYCTKSENMKHALSNGLYVVKKGKEHHLYGKIGKDHKDSVKVKQLDIHGKLIKIWDSIADINRNLKISTGNICIVCQGKRKTAGGYKWEYA